MIDRPDQCTELCVSLLGRVCLGTRLANTPAKYLPGYVNLPKYLADLPFTWQIQSITKQSVMRNTDIPYFVLSNLFQKENDWAVQSLTQALTLTTLTLSH